MKLSGPVSLALLLVMTLVCAAYLTVGVLHVDPRRELTRVTVLVGSSGGLMRTSQVDLRGLRIGEVESIATTADGLAIRLGWDARYRIPADSEVRIANLSAAGEQFLDFRPHSAAGPYLRDGSVIPAAQVRVATTVSEALARIDALNSRIDPNQVADLAATVSTGVAGRDAEIRNLTAALTMTGRLLRDRREQLTRLYRNAQTLGDNLNGYGPTVASGGGDIGRGLPEVLRLIDAFQGYSYAGERIWDDPLDPLVHRIDQYLSELGPDLAHIATVLKPATTVLEPVRVDAGSIVDLLSAAFPGGPARITIQPPR
ncbi:MlaD family protein [Nocardia pseudobrasiliensis]|uniref:Phospholipid/cholesterol/gamma-HCH transport system substrate-binding protein n=1 Tax=Nocardia pseudobrasiliensis TaxID=45979 RepID=A0A370IB64_9NOCA|nr:MlaD family protein [Nocardia pseudobrasiliensis]RDI67948.1 phospholipid/cholesterol/gamma-HCH transport system substrate-binding protein [Nocardia pseudobrasiliensis]